MFSVFALTLVALTSDVFASPPTLIVLSFESFNPPDSEDETLPFFTNLRQQGAGPAGITPIFPVTTFSNHFNMATGVSSDVHGVYNDSMFDSEGAVISHSEKQFRTNKDLVPIWTENQKAGDGRISGVMMWPGSEHEYHGVTPTYVQPYDTNIEWSTRADTIVDWMTRSDKKANLVMAYFEKTTLYYDVEKKSDNINAYNKKVDDIINRIHTNLKAKIGDTFNMVILSDHGTQDINIEHILKIDYCVPIDERTKIILSGPLVFVKVVEESKFNAVFNDIIRRGDANLKYNVFKRSDIASKYGVDIPALENVIVLIANDFHVFYKSEDFNNIVNTLERPESFTTEMHGYDIANQEMTGYLAGVGPKFKTNLHMNDSFSIAEIYPMFKFLLELPNEASTVQKNIELDYNVKTLLVDN